MDAVAIELQAMEWLGGGRRGGSKARTIPPCRRLQVELEGWGGCAVAAEGPYLWRVGDSNPSSGLGAPMTASGRLMAGSRCGT